MNNEIAITATNLSKIYKLYENPIHRLKESLHPFRKKYHKDFYALQDLSFEIKKGDTVGIIGKNGSGKSTLLKIITGVLTPSAGQVKVNGKVSALLELGTGFNPDLTGIENVYFSGTIMGYSKEQIDEKLDDILSFADIGEFANQPVKTYSSGMFVRLAFSVATSVDPEILIIDEALSVGDMFFQAKSMMRMKKMIDNGATVIYVSHDITSIKSICRKAILLDKGMMLDYGRSDEVVEKYLALKVSGEQKVVSSGNNGGRTQNISTSNNEQLCFIDNEEFWKKASFQRISNGKASFVNVQLLDENGNMIETVEYEQNVVLRMAIVIHEDIHVLGYAYHIRDHHGMSIVYSDSIIEGKNLRFPRKDEKYVIDWRFKVSLNAGIYGVLCALSIPIDINISHVEYCDYVPIALQFRMEKRRESPLFASVHWKNLVTVNKV
jgi:lipopolysaccharide transport system ATP-binding protein